MNNVDNRVLLTGFAGGDAELKTLGNNKKLARVSIAVNESFRNSAGAEVRNTHWFNLVFWNAKAEDAAKLIRKGARFTIDGRLSSQSYEAKDGTKRYNIEVVVNEFTVGDGPMADQTGYN